jgi:acyl-CoA thioesterase I
MQLISRWLVPILVLSLAFSAHAQVKIACVGNSITYYPPSYTDVLQSLLGSGYTVQNKGAPGTTLLRRVDGPYWNTGLFASLFSEKPDIITIKLGTNDSKNENWSTHSVEFSGDYNAMIDTLLTITPTPKIWLVLCLPAYNNGFGINGDIIHNQIVPAIQSVAASRNLPVIDCHAPLLNHPELVKDGVHPNEIGADSIAHIFYRALTCGQTGPKQPLAHAGSPTNLQPVLSSGQTVRINGQSGILAQSSSCALYSLMGTRIGVYPVARGTIVMPHPYARRPGVLLVLSKQE